MCNELHTFATTLLPQTHAVRLTQVTVEKFSIQLHLTATAPTAACPLCCVPSSLIHSGYQRHMTDLSWGTHEVRIHLTVRKFVCRNPSCERRIFTERLPDLVATYARHTTQPSPKFPLHLWLAKPTLSSRANTVSHIRYNAR
jgi:transposase